MNDQNDLDTKYTAAYDAEADIYDNRSFGSKRGELSARYKNETVLKLLSCHGGIHENARILDCPSGTGRITHAIVTGDYPFGRIDAVDISEGMLKVNEAKLPAHHDKVAFTVTNMKKLKFESGSFDGAVIASFAYLIPQDEYKDYVADIYRVLKPGGVAVIEVSNTLCAYNPLSLVKVLKHRYLQKKKVKSSATFWEIGKLFGEFEVVEYRGAEFPMIFSNYSVYRAESKLLGGLPILKWFSGKFIVALRKPV